MFDYRAGKSGASCTQENITRSRSALFIYLFIYFNNFLPAANNLLTIAEEEEEEEEEKSAVLSRGRRETREKCGCCRRTRASRRRS